MTTSHPHSSEKRLEQVLIDLYASALLHGESQANGVLPTPLQRERTIAVAKAEVAALLAQSHQSAEAALLEKLQPLLVDEPEYSNLNGNAGYWEVHGRNKLRAELRTALKPPKEEDV